MLMTQGALPSWSSAPPPGAGRALAAPPGAWPPPLAAPAPPGRGAPPTAADAAAPAAKAARRRPVEPPGAPPERQSQGRFHRSLQAFRLCRLWFMEWNMATQRCLWLSNYSLTAWPLASWVTGAVGIRRPSSCWPQSGLHVIDLHPGDLEPQPLPPNTW